MIFLSIHLFLILTFKIGVESQSFINVAYNDNLRFCSSNQICTFVEHCSTVSRLMDRNLLPISRFRQTVCGYDKTKAKVCCDVSNNSITPSFHEEDDTYVSDTNSSPECGRSLIRSNVDTIGTYPFVARIGFINSATGEVKYSCSGVIVNEQTILTTASCALAKSEKYKLYSVLIGEFDIETDPDCNTLFCGHKTQSHNISYVIKHPNYQSSSFTNNVALLRLEEPIQFSVTAQPVCFLSRDRRSSVVGTSVLVGWGKLSENKVKSGKQESLHVKIVPNHECSSYYNQGFSVELCVSGKKVPCSGYSGSPLLLRYHNTHFLSGILSYGSSCNETVNFPFVFVNVQRYARWILENC